jgi:peptide/nickel transport system substrate-binding protein
MFKLTHNCLTGFNETTKEVVPELAKSWKVSGDRKTWTFNLRDDVYFHNGEKMTADDWLFTIQYGKSASDGTVKAFYKAIDPASAPDKYTLVINLAKPNMDLLVTLATPYYSVLNRKAVEADAVNGPAIGTGPWVNKAFVSGDYTLLERFDKYWGERPVTKTLRFRYIPEASARLIALENHEIDACQAPNNTELDLIKANKELKMISYQSSALTYLAFNMDSEVCRDANLRLAIAYALNVQDVIDGAASGLAGKAEGMWGFYQFGYFDDWKSVGLSNYDLNLQKAKEYMAKSKYSKGVTLSFMTSTTWRVNALQIIQQQLAPLGIKVTIDEVDAAGLTSKASSGNYQVIMYSVAFGPEGDDARRTLYPTSAANHAKYNNPRVAELLDLAAAEPDSATRLKDYKEIQVIVHTECPYIPLYYANSGVAINKDLEGAVFSPSGAHDYTYVRVSAK